MDFSAVTSGLPLAEYSITNKSASKSLNKATASATGKKYINGICIQTVPKKVTLTCSSKGILS